jgi:hypothetical protein
LRPRRRRVDRGDWAKCSNRSFPVISDTAKWRSWID